MISPVVKAIAWIGIFCILILYGIQYSKACKTVINQQVRTLFEKQYGAQFSGKLETISCFPPRIVYAQVALSPIGASLWQIKTERIALSLDLLRYWLKGALGISLHLEGVSLFSQVIANKLACADFFKTLLVAQETTLPIVFTDSSLSNAFLHLEDYEQGLTLKTSWGCSLQQLEEASRFNALITDGSILYQGKEWVQKMSGNFSADIGQNGLNTIFFALESSLLGLPQEQHKVLCSGSYNQGIITSKVTVGPCGFSIEGPLGALQISVQCDSCTVGPVACSLIQGRASITSAGADGKMTIVLGGKEVVGNWRWDRALQTFSADIKGPHNLLLSVESLNNQPLKVEATVPLSALKTMVEEWYGFKVAGDGIVTFVGSMSNKDLFTGRCSYKDGLIRLGQSYNCIQSLDAHFSCSLSNLSATITDLVIRLQKGTVTASTISGSYDAHTHDWQLHAPILFSDCFVNWAKDLQLDLSGAVVTTKKRGEVPYIRGFVTLDSGKLSEHIFSEKTQAMLGQASVASSNSLPVMADLNVRTKKPLVVKTEQLETSAHLSVHCFTDQETIAVAGEVVLSGGVFHFPAYSLPLVSGSIMLSPDRPNDPTIELIGQGRIKKYLVTLSVTGSSSDPQIIFESSPSLTQEQIMMLLIAGSEEESCNIVVPALVMRNVENVLFGQASPLVKERWFEPLKRIRFVPRFTDQTGRGGFKGTLEIEVSKQLRALIEKNFSLTEDVFCEVEYQVTDDMTFRVSRDERGDLGAEFEMRFKF